MADEKKKEPVKYKFGERELDLQRYINNIDKNVAEYVRNQNWNDGQRQEFMNAYNQYFTGLKDQLANGTSRFTTDSFGTILDSDGTLSDTDNDGIDSEGSEYYYDNKGNALNTSEFNALKKRKQKNYKTFSANRQVATYFDKVGRGLLDKMAAESTESKPADNAFDLNKHGFIKYWGDRYHPGSTTFDGTAVLELDPLVDGKRARTNRTARLKQDFMDYINQIGDYDFSNTRFKNKEGYAAFMKDIMGKLDDGLDENDILDLGQAGITREFLNPFLSQDEVVTKTAEQKAAEEAKKKADDELAEKKAREEAMKKFIENQQALSTQSIGNSYSDNNWFTVGIPFNEKWYGHDGTFDHEKFLDTLPKGTNIASMIDSFISDPYNTKWGNQRYALLKYIVDSGKAQPINNNASLQGFYYIPRASDRTRATALVYNPSTQQMFETFIGNTHLWDSIMTDFKRNQGWLDATSPYMRKEGGVLYAQQGASLGQDVANYINSLSRENLEERAKKEGKTANQQRASERYINSDNVSYANPDAGFTSVEWARLAAGGADIVSALSAWAPGMGTAVSLGTGLGSTVANLYADIADDSVSAWDATKNTALNLGMDLVGLVPGGGAATKFAKIGKNLVKVAPKVLALIGTAGHALNTPQYIESWSKLSSDEKLDAQDWNNILSSIQAILGPAAGIGQYAKNKGHYGPNKAANAAKADTGTVSQDKVAVKMLDASGKEKTVLFDGDDASAIRKAQETGKIEDLKAATVDKFEDLKGWTLKENDFGLRKPTLSWDLTKMSPVGSKNTNVNDLILDVTTRQGMDFARARGFHDDITSFHTPGRRWQDIDDAYIEAQLQPLKAKSDAYDRMYNYTQRKSADLDTQIVTADANLNTAKSRGSNKTSAELDVLVQQMKRDKSAGVHATKQSEITNSQNNLALAQKEFASAERKIKRLEKMEIAATTETSRAAIRNQIEDAKLVRDTASQKAKEAQDIIDSNTKWLNDNTDARIAQLEAEQLSIKSLEDAVQNLKDSKTKYGKYTKEGKTKLREDFESRYPVDADGNITVKDPSTGREITRNFKEILEKYKIAHKQGGTLNLAVVRKFSGGGANNHNARAFADGEQPFISDEKKRQLEAMNRLGEQNWLAIDNTYDNAINPEKWNSYYNNDAIFADLESHMSTQDATKFIEAANKLNSLGADFSTPILNKKGYQEWNTIYDQTGLNKYFGSDASKFDYLGPSTWNRNLLLQKMQEKYGDKGLKIGDKTVQFVNGQWEEAKPVETPVEEPEETPAVTTQKGNLAGTRVLENEADGEENTEKSPWLKEFIDKNSTFLKYSLPRALYADRMNHRITDKAIAAEKPFLQDPFQVHRTVKSDLDAEAWGQRASAMINSLTSNMQTSDFNAYQAGRLEGMTKGLDYLIQGNEKSNQALKASEELAWQQEKENTKNRHDVAMQNRLAMHQTTANKAKYEQAFLNKQHEIWDTVWKEQQFKADQEQKENKAYADAFAKSDISNYVTANLAKLDPTLSPEAVKLYQQVKDGVIAPSSLASDTTKYNLFAQAARRASELEEEQFRIYKGIPESKWKVARQMAEKKDNIQYDKEGAKIRIQNSKVKTKNADRFTKQIKSDLDRNEKALARLSKSIYSYIKGKMV